MAEEAEHRFNVAGLDDLFRYLASAGFKVGPAGRTRAAALITEFVARDALPLDGHDLALWLQPIFVTAPDERARFVSTVEAWEQGAQRIDAPDIEPAQPPLARRAEPSYEQSEFKLAFWRRIPRAAWIGLALVAIGVSLAAAPPVRTRAAALWESYIAWLSPAPQTPSSEAPAPAERAASTPEFAATTPEASGLGDAPDVQSGQDALIGAIVRSAARYDFAPTLEELYVSMPNDGSVVLPGNVRDVARTLGVPPDRPVPLYRADFALRLLEAMAPGTVQAARDQAVAAGLGQALVIAMLGMSPSALLANEANASPGAELSARVSRDGAIMALVSPATRSPLIGEGADAIAVALDGRILQTSAVGTPRLSDSAGRLIRTFDGAGQSVGAIAMRRDGLSALISSGSGIIWRVSDGARLAELSGGDDSLHAAAYSVDGALIATGWSSGAIRIWDAASGSLLTTYQGSDEGIVSVAIDSENMKVAAGSRDGRVAIWDLATNALINEATVHPVFVSSIAFSPDGERLLTTSLEGDFALLDSAGAVITQLALNADQLSAGAFSRDGDIVALVTNTGLVIFVDGRNGGALSRFQGPDAEAWDIEFDPAGGGVVVAASSGIFRYQPIIAIAGPIAQEMNGRALTSAELGARVRRALSLPSPDEAPPGGLGYSDENIARAWALVSFDAGLPLNIADPPWPTSAEQRRAPIWGAQTPWIAAGIVAFGALVLWLWSALNTRGFLARRMPDDPGRITDLAAEDRASAQRAELGLRIAARRMLERREGLRQMDMAASVEATARAGGFFTPVSRAHRQIPEYLFLIDSRSRSDHDARRALDYVERLRGENVKADFFYFEGAPDRVREDIGMPLVPIETITSQYATRRLIIVGDAALMLERDGGVGRWADSVRVWEDRALMTTVPADEWGEEEEKLATALDLLVRPLSSAALSELPGALRRDGDRVRIARSDEMDARPLPGDLREAGHVWTLETEPQASRVDAMMGELMAYLGQGGFRWLAACAVYPAIEWDLTMALGWRLKEGEAGAESALMNESRIAKLSELPWLRTGQMPQWLRERLLDEMDPSDRQVVRAFLAELLDAARQQGRARSGEIALSFVVEGGRGRSALNDETFVQFLLENPRARDTRALEASKKVRDLLLPPLGARLFRPGELAVLAGGLLMAAAAFIVAPRLGDTPLTTGAWAPLAMLALAPLLLWWIAQIIGPIMRGLGALAQDPMGVLRRLRSETKSRSERDNRIEQLASHARGARRVTLGFVALLLASLAYVLVVHPIMMALGLTQWSWSELEAARSALRLRVGEAWFGALIAAALLLGAMVALLLARLCVVAGQAFLDASIGDRSELGLREAPNAGTRTLSYIFGACVFAGLYAVSASGNQALPWLAPVALFPGALVAALWCARRARMLRRARLGLPEAYTLSSKEVSVRLRRPLGRHMARALRRQGVAAHEQMRGRVPGVLVHGEELAPGVVQRENDAVGLVNGDFVGWRGEGEHPAFQRFLRELLVVLRGRLEEASAPNWADVRRQEVKADRQSAPAPQQDTKAPAPRRYVFVAFSRRDARRVEPILQQLRRLGVPIYVFDNIAEGEVEIRNSIRDAAGFIVVHSENASQSRWVEMEIETALRYARQDKRYLFVPFVLDGDLRGLPMPIAMYQGVKANVREDEAGWALTGEGRQALDQFARAVQERLREWERPDE
ncbi:MAG: TIR domain-containing protein [Hyphomonadaceae bacterium JAD_PAG50586_4]|nr:MAG: TIR domain-containing protein [Hyphomonadaceae bacterium JAD_PAG50586_4]